MQSYVGTCKGICSYNLVLSCLIQLLPLQSSTFVVYFSNTFWHVNQVFPKGSAQNEIFPLLLIYHLPFRSYRGVKICFHSCHYQNHCFSFLSCRSCHTCVAHIALVSLVLHSCCSCLSRVALESLELYSCYKIDQIVLQVKFPKITKQLANQFKLDPKKFVS